ncbi:hypothetical protein PHYPSEUDO_001786 [Phytophthora pseudosyringae]|uniref:HECT domain-containing protein n=1 Tax=Phytophthora pseudosyringae TaxID=221518 RepID=A0A8T1VY34_9STRA|nr:hypothetical protein PHYPSEUDO_001786 [Phytophthora pseudosyringae]
MMEMLDNDALDLDFSVMERVGDCTMTVDLIPNERNIEMTDADKHAYLERKFEHLLLDSVADQLYVFPKELNYLVCGFPAIDVNDLEKPSLPEGNQLAKFKFPFLPMPTPRTGLRLNFQPVRARQTALLLNFMGQRTLPGYRVQNNRFHSLEVANPAAYLWGLLYLGASLRELPNFSPQKASDIWPVNESIFAP